MSRVFLTKEALQWRAPCVTLYICERGGAALRSYSFDSILKRIKRNARKSGLLRKSLAPAWIPLEGIFFRQRT
jgi:hypothetical protein